jgi:predicted DNA-binding protein
VYTFAGRVRFAMAEDTSFDSSVSTRCSEEFKQELERLAAAEKRPLSNYVRLILEKHVEELSKSKKAA